jgi:hypothetical protein
MGIEPLWNDIGKGKPKELEKGHFTVSNNALYAKKERVINKFLEHNEKKKFFSF